MKRKSKIMLACKDAYYWMAFNLFNLFVNEFYFHANWKHLSILLTLNMWFVISVFWKLSFFFGGGGSKTENIAHLLGYY